MGLEETQTGATTPTLAHELARDPAAFEPPAPPAPAVESAASSPAPVATSPSSPADPAPAPATQPAPAAAPAAASRKPGRPPRAARAGEDPAKLELRRLKDRIRKAKTPEAAAAALRDFQAAQASEADAPEAEESAAIASAETAPAPAPTAAPAAAEPPKPAEPAKIMGADSETVALIGPHALQAWGRLADKTTGTRYDFRGDREMVFFPGTPFEQTVKANPERDLAQLTAVVIAKHLPKAINAATQPEYMLAGVALMTFGFPAVGHAVEVVRDWWRGRAERAAAAESVA